MKVLIAGGGTGGHVYPGIAVANQIRNTHPEWEIVFIGKKTSIEGRIVPQAGYRIEHLAVYALERGYSAFKKFQVVGHLLKSFFRVFSILKKESPDIVIGTGGYVCGPVVLSAYLKKIPTLIMEQNIIPGYTIKTLSKYSDIVCTSFEGSKQYMKFPDRCVFTGNPVREEFRNHTRQSSRKELGLQESDLFIVSFGGSLGARSINQTMIELMEKWKDDTSIHITHISGRDIYDEFLPQYESLSLRPEQLNRLRFLSYADNMPQLLNAADLVISRSGASSIAEINYVGIPAVYIPFPYAVNDHQTKNALDTAKHNASIIIPDDQLDSELLFHKVSQLFADKDRLNQMAEASYELGMRDSAELIEHEIEKLLKIHP